MPIFFPWIKACVLRTRHRHWREPSSFPIGAFSLWLKDFLIAHFTADLLTQIRGLTPFIINPARAGTRSSFR